MLDKWHSSISFHLKKSSFLPLTTISWIKTPSKNLPVKDFSVSVDLRPINIFLGTLPALVEVIETSITTFQFLYISTCGPPLNAVLLLQVYVFLFVAIACKLKSVCFLYLVGPLFWSNHRLRLGGWYLWRHIFGNQRKGSISREFGWFAVKE